MVSIRLSRLGTKHKPFYRIVAVDREKPRESRYIELIGHYDPKKDPQVIQIDLAKYANWIARGAKPSDTVKSLVKRFTSEKKGG